MAPISEVSAEPLSEPRNGDYESDKGRSDHREHDIGEGRDKPSDHVDRRRRSYSRDRDRRRRSRSRSSDRRRYRSRSRSRDRRGSRRDRYPSPRRDRDRQRDRRRGGGGGPTTEEDELKKLDRTLRTVQAYNLSLRAEERDIFKLFSQAGPIMDIKIIRDRTTGRSKGFAYIEYQHHESVAPGLHLTGQLILGQPVMVKGSEAEKNMAWEAAQAAKRQAAMGISAAAAAPAAGTVPGRLLVSNLHPSLTEADLRPIFDNFGPVDFMMLQRDAMGVSQGTAILQYQNAAHATSARDNLSGVLDIQGMKIMLIDAPLEYNPAMAGVPGVTVPGMSGAAAPAVVEERLDVDADDGGGMRMTAQSRVELMSRLAANAGIEVPQLPTYGMGGPMGPAVGQPAGGVPQELAMEQGVLGPASPIPTQCLLIKNMFDPAEETEPNWGEEIAADVKDECSKYGQVLFVHVDTESKGFVYLKFESTQAASAAQKALHGRWFNQRQLCADFQFTPIFNAHFKL